MTPDAAAPREEPQTEAGRRLLREYREWFVSEGWANGDWDVDASVANLGRDLRRIETEAAAEQAQAFRDLSALYRQQSAELDALRAAASARAGRARNAEYRETAERLVRDLWAWMVRSEPFISAVLVLAEDKGPGLNLITDVPDLRARVLAFLAAAAAPVSEAAELRWLDYAETWQAWEAYNRAATKVGSGFTDEQMTGASALLGWLTVAYLGRNAGSTRGAIPDDPAPVTPALTAEERRDRELGAAWRAAEEALPSADWEITVASSYYRRGYVAYANHSSLSGSPTPDPRFVEAPPFPDSLPTPTAALTALAAALGASHD